MTESLTSQLDQATQAAKPADLPDLSEVISAFIKRRLPSGKHPLGQAARHHFKRTGKQLRSRMAPPQSRDPKPFAPRPRKKRCGEADTRCHGHDALQAMVP